VPKASHLPGHDPQEDAAELRSRTDARKERLAREELLMRLSEALVSSGAAVLARLELSEVLADAIRNTQSVRAGSARNRALRLVRSALRNEDFEAIQRKLGAVHGTGAFAARHRQRDRL
jgi:ribosomal 50S subunit-associated protein YjgA (DUF615 family)